MRRGIQNADCPAQMGEEMRPERIMPGSEKKGAERRTERREPGPEGENVEKHPERRALGPPKWGES